MYGVRTARYLRHFLAVALICATWARAQERTLSEYQVKALFIFNLVQFVEWPASAFPAPDTPFYIGVLGDNPFGDDLLTAIKGEKVGGRPLVLVQGRSLEAVKHCQLLFVSRSERARVDTILAEYARKPVLTLGDVPNFAARGGVLNFYLDGAKVRFELNRAAAQQAGLKLSAQLIRLAKPVGSPGGGP
ncbi:MAG: YfiR family protein [Verrucomicrobiota bacterium]